MARDPRMTMTASDTMDADLNALSAAQGGIVGMYQIRVYPDRLSRQRGWVCVADTIRADDAPTTRLAEGASYSPDRAIETMAQDARHRVQQADDLATFAASRGMKGAHR